MLDPQILNKNLEEFKENLQKREIELDLDVLIELDDKRRKAKFEAEQVRAEQNKLSKEIAKSDKKTKDDLLSKATELSDKFKKLSNVAEKEEKLFFEHWVKIPNIVDVTSPVGSSEEDNKEIK